MDINNLFNIKNIDVKTLSNKNVNFSNNAVSSDINFALRSGTLDVIGDKKDYQNYINEGMTPNDWENLEHQYQSILEERRQKEYEDAIELERYLADSQSMWTKAGNALVQTVSDLTLGTIGGTANVLDFLAVKSINTIGDIFGAKTPILDDDYHNPISDLTDAAQDYIREKAPVRVAPGVDIQNGGLTSLSWWLSNAPTIVSSLTLMVPGVGATKAVSAIGKTLKLGKAVSKARRWATGINKIEEGQKLNKLQAFVNNPKNIAKANQAFEDIHSGLVMRVAENYQEAGDVHVQTYENALEHFNNMSDFEFGQWKFHNAKLLEGTNAETKDDVAKVIAKKAADRTFSMDFGNVIFDIWQLHNLKNLGKVVSKAEGRAVNTAQKKAIETAEEFATKTAVKEGVKETGKKITKDNIFKRGIKATGSWIKGGAKSFAAEASEGVEEAVNYIAQQEGLTYGKLLLEEGYKDNYNTGIIGGMFKSWTNMQGNIADYASTAELQESAFWGVMGGVVFNAASNKARNIKFNLDERRKEKAEQEINPKTGESTSRSFWSKLLESPQDKAARTAIENRIARIQTLNDNLKQINDGKNIYSLDEEGNAKVFEGTTEAIEHQKELARLRAENEFISDIAVDAMNSGTYHLLEAYFSSNAVKQAMVESGVTTQEEVNAFTERTLRTLKEASTEYAKQSAHIYNQVTALNAAKDYGETVPLEYARIIAKNNFNTILTAKAIDRAIEEANISAAEREALSREMGIDSNDLQRTKQMLNVGSLIDAYRRLEADEQKIKSMTANSPLQALSQQTQLHAIASQKENILNTLKGVQIESVENAGLIATILAEKNKGSYKRLDRANTSGSFYENNPDFVERKDEEIVKELRGKWNISENISDETIIQQAKVVAKEVDNAFGENGLYNTNNALFKDYINIAQLNTQKVAVMSQLANTQIQIKEQIDLLHNKFNAGRQAMIIKATEVIQDAFMQYKGIKNINDNTLIDIITAAYKGDKVTARQLAEEYMKDAKELGNVTAEEFIDALDVFNFTSASNQQLYAKIMGILQGMRNHRIQTASEIDEESDIEKGEKKSEFKKPNTQQSELQTDNNTSDNVKSSDEAESRSQTDSEQLDNRKKSKVRVIINNNGQVHTINTRTGARTNNIDTFVNEDESIEIDLKNSNDRNRLAFAKSDAFEIDNDVDLYDVNDPWIVTDNPIYRKVDKEYKLIQKGRISRKSTAQQEGLRTDGTSPGTSPVEGLTQTGPALRESNKSSNEAKDKQSKEDDSKEDDSDKELFDLNESFLFDVNDASRNPSTGERGKQDSDSSKKGEVELISDIASTIVKHMPSLTATDVDYDSIREAVKKEFEEKAEEYDASLEEINAKIDKTIDDYITALEKVRNMQAGLQQTGGMLEFASRIAEVETSDFGSFFKSAVDAFMEEYKKIIIVPTVNGKQVVCLEDVLRICNRSNETSDNSVAKAMFDVLYAYFNSAEGRAKYEVIDLKKGNSILENIGKSDEQLAIENEVANNGLRVDIIDTFKLMNEADEETKKQFYDIYNSIEIGDTLEIISTDKTISIVKNGMVVGRLTKPKIVSDHLEQTNMGWRTDIKLDANNRPVSKLKDIIIKLFTGNTVAHDNLRRLLTELSISGEITDAQVEIFLKNPLIAAILDASKNNPNSNLAVVDTNQAKNNEAKLLQHLARLWQYTQISNNAVTKEAKLIAVENNINRYFKKLYNEYNYLLTVPEKAQATVTGMTDGALNTVTSNILADYNKLPLANEGIADLENAKIAIVPVRNPGTIRISGKPDNITPAWKPGSTIIGLFGKNKQPTFVNAIGLKLSDYVGFDNDNSIFGDIVNNAFTLIGESLASIAKFINDGRSQGKTVVYPDLSFLKDQLENLLVNYNNNSKVGLFRALQNTFSIRLMEYNGVVTGINISYKTNNGDSNEYNTFKIFIRSIKNNTSTLGIKVGNNSANFNATSRVILGELYNFLADKVTINIDEQAITSDNNQADQFDGWIKKRNGKIIVDIPRANGQNYHKEYDNYSDFLIKGGLVRVNTQIAENGTNFKPRSKNQRANQNLYVSLPNKGVKTNEIREDKTSGEYLDSTSVKEDFDTAKEIINNNKENAGIELFRHALGDKVFDEFKVIMEETGEEFNLLDEFLPAAIQYDSNINGIRENGSRNLAVAYAEGYRGAKYRVFENGKETKHSFGENTRVAVGSIWLNMLSSRDVRKRKQAIRKLIHEQLHNRLGQYPKEAEKLKKVADEIYDEFINNLAKDKKAAKKANDTETLKALNNLSDTFKGYRKDRTLLEEFLVESLTNELLVKYLNSIETTDVNNGKKDNLFTKLVKALAKFFGWQIRDNSLYMKELNLLRDAISGEDVIEDKNEQIDTETKTEESDETVKKESDKQKEEKSDKEITEEDKKIIEEKSDAETMDELNNEDDIDINEDEDEFLSSIEEVQIDKNGFVRTDNLDAFVSKLPLELQESYERLIEDGWVETKCK